MAQFLTASMDASAVIAAIDKLGDAALRYTKPVTLRTALRIREEQLSRVHRRTGQRLKIDVREDYVKVGHIVATADVRSDEGREAVLTQRKLFGNTRKGVSNLTDEAHVGTYLEYGTVDMPAHPFFWEAARLEEANFDRDIREAVQDGIDEVGLGS